MSGVGLGLDNDKPRSDSYFTQRNNRAYLSCLARGNIAGRQGNYKQNERNRKKYNGIDNMNSIKQGRDRRRSLRASIAKRPQPTDKSYKKQKPFDPEMYKRRILTIRSRV